jgi:hypothetical protein
VVRVRAGGVALIAQQQAPAQALVGELVPGAAARIVRLAGAEVRTLCSGAAVPAFDPAAPAIVSLSIGDGRATLVAGGATLAACELEAAPRGAWGVAARGGATDAQVVVDTVTVSRAISR